MFNISHRFVYAVLAGLYAGACLGLDKSLVTALVSMAYVALALDRE